MKHFLLGFSFLVCSLSSIGQTSMVMDINSGMPNSNPSRLTPFNNYLVFFADDGLNGNELWALTDTGAILVYNINPGSASSAIVSNFTQMAVEDGKIYFPADDGTSGQELYSWDGDMGHPPMLVADVNPITFPSTINEVINFNGKIYFTAYHPNYGYEIWMHDPANNSTNVATAIGGGSLSSNPKNLTPYKGKLYFSATNNSGGTGELYAYDPATNNSSMIADIYPGSLGSDPQSLLVVNDVLYFTANSPTYGRELYSYDGKNTTRLSDVNPGNGSSIIISATGQNRIGALNGKIYFGGDDGSTGAQLYQHNSNNGTQTLTFNINPSSTSFPSSFTNYGDALYFSAYDDMHGVELWKYDGDSIPEMVADIDTVGSGNPMNMVVFNNILYFSAYTPDNGIELYRYVDSAVITGVQNVKFNGNVTVYPNPATTATNIELNLQKTENLNVTISDITGKAIYNSGVRTYTSGKSTLNIPLSDYAAGMYFFRITNDKGSMYFSGRIIKQ